MKRFSLLALLLVASCGVNKPQISYITVQRDSLIIHDTTIVSYLTKERIVDIVPVYDTLKMETTYSESVSYVDTSTHSLKGSLVQKDDIPVRTEVKFIDRVEVRDSIITVPVEVAVEKPVVVEKYPLSFWLMLAGYVAAAVYALLKFMLKSYLK